MPWWLVLIIILGAALPTALSYALAAQRARHTRRMEAAVRETLPTDLCLACGSQDVRAIAPDVVRCAACGFVGGQGMADWQRQRQADAHAAMAPAERGAQAKELLLRARVHLDDAGSLLERALAQSRLDMAGLSFDRGREKQSLWAEAASEMTHARALARDAAALMGAGGPDEPTSLEFSSLLLALDVSWISDGLGVDAAVHARIKATRTELDRLLTSIEEQLATLSSAHRSRRAR